MHRRGASGRRQAQARWQLEQRRQLRRHPDLVLHDRSIDLAPRRVERGKALPHHDAVHPAGGAREIEPTSCPLHLQGARVPALRRRLVLVAGGQLSLPLAGERAVSEAAQWVGTLVIRTSG